MRPCPICGAAHSTCGPSREPKMVTDLKPMALPTSRTMWRSEKRVYLDKDDQVVKDPKKQDPVRMLVAAGCEIPLAEAVRYGLAKEGDAPAEGSVGAPRPFSIQGLGVPTIAALTKAKLYDEASLKAASDEELLKLPGMDATALAIVRAALGG